jgi:hypothetical protein
LADGLWVVWRKKHSAVETGWKVDRMPRNCTVCLHPQRQEIEAELHAGLPYRDIARRHNISKDAVSRHRASHVSLHTTPALAIATKIMALLNQAETASMWNTTLLTVREARHWVEDLLIQLNHGIER